MIRSASHRRILRFVALLVVTLLVSPVAVADDYAFLHTGPATAQKGVLHVAWEPPDALSDEGADSHVCTCLVCLVTLGESFAPLVPAPQPGEVLDSSNVVLSHAPHIPRIFHPPIA